MREKIRRWLYDIEKFIDLQKYISIDAEGIDEELKNRIVEMENLAENLAKKMQLQYAAQFEEQKKRNFSVWLSRDLNGDVLESLSADCCLDKEYRSRIAIDYNDPGYDNDAYAAAITIWHHHGTFFKRFGTLFDAAKNDLEKEIEEMLKNLLD
ncbi:hypothetical protein QWY16_12360 [Planococcus shenhongbingii]|uniref:hypothetical protein n=1 Tax=Planococcus shenhongbingii TaxID=3058398 RepID=UPI00262EC183|nr:hypothetical protein [Planococcus sp. N016]WKA57292.1 hypothetical protein QWY16_12360 [Planococcus sp. N016]